MSLQDFIRARAQETYPEPPSPAHSEITAKMVPKVCAGLPQDFSVLDVGCGQGVAFNRFVESGAAIVVGLTNNAEDFKAAQEHIKRSLLHYNAEVRLGDMHDLGFALSFDLIWARHVLEHSIAPYYVLSEFHRILKPDGVLYVEVPAPETASHHESNPNHYSVLGQRAWCWLIRKAGFDIAEALSWQLKTIAGPDVYFSFTCKKLCFTAELPETVTAGVSATNT